MKPTGSECFGRGAVMGGTSTSAPTSNVLDSLSGGPHGGREPAERARATRERRAWRCTPHKR